MRGRGCRSVRVAHRPSFSVSIHVQSHPLTSELSTVSTGFSKVVSRARIFLHGFLMLHNSIGISLTSERLVAYHSQPQLRAGEPERRHTPPVNERSVFSAIGVAVASNTARFGATRAQVCRYRVVSPPRSCERRTGCTRSGMSSPALGTAVPRRLDCV